MKRVVPTTEYELMLALDKAAIKAPTYATLLKLSTEMVAERVADAAAFHYTLGIVGNIVTGGKDWTAFKKLLLKGPDSGATIPFPLPIDFSTAPVAVKPGISARYSKFAAYCKLQPGCTENVQIDLGIAGTATSARDLDTVQPALKPVKRADGIFVGWSWDGLFGVVDMLEMCVDRGDGQGEKFLVTDSTPDYLDTFPQPAALTKWTYRAIWRIGEDRVGLWSNPVTIIVGG